MSAQGDWQTWLLFLHGGDFGCTDPQFDIDMSFFAWDYPVYRLVLGFGFTAVLFALRPLRRGALPVRRDPAADAGAEDHHAGARAAPLLVFVFVVLKAVAYWLDRYGLVFSDRGTFTGARYTDVNASLPAKTILFLIAC